MAEINFVPGVDPHLTDLPIFAGSRMLADLGQVTTETARQAQQLGLDYQGVVYSRQIASLCVLVERRFDDLERRLQQLVSANEILRQENAQLRG